MNITELKIKYHGLIQFILYGIVGGVAFVADFAGLMLLYRFCGINYIVAATVGFILGCMVNYGLSKILVFKEEYKSKTLEFILFSIIGIIGLILTDLFMWAFVDGCGLAVFWSKIIVTIIVFFWNFLARKFFMYTGHNRLMKEDSK